MMDKILVYTAIQTARIQYGVTTLFSRISPATIRISSDYEGFTSYHGPKIFYGNDVPEDYRGIQVPQHDLMLQTGIDQGANLRFPDAMQVDEPASGTLSFDLFAFAFVQLSRYEEYLPFTADQHGRFPASESIARQEGFLHRPLVDEWALQLEQLLLHHYPNVSLVRHNYRYLPTYDIDMAWAFRHRGLLRNTGGLLKNLWQGRKDKVRTMLRVFAGLQEDPFYAFRLLEHIHQQYALSPVFFFLLGNLAPYDRNTSPRKPAFQRLIYNMSKVCETGIHPSYASNEQAGLLEKEIQRLQAITQAPVIRSRQHFLKLRFPDTYRGLLAAGIREEYSMGYADAIGFRAGTARSFFWYDLEAEKVTALEVIPFQVMDVTLKNYLKLSQAEVLQEIETIIQQCKKVNGTFCSLWHNSSFDADEGWQGWDLIFEKMVEKAIK